MSKKMIYLISVVLLLSLANSATAEPNNWTGATNTSWMDPTNWDPAGVPTSEATIEEWDEVGLTMVTPACWPVIDLGTGATPVVEKLRVGYHSPAATTAGAVLGDGPVVVVVNHGYLDIISGTVVVSGDLELGYGDKWDIGPTPPHGLPPDTPDFSINDVYGEINMSGGTLSIGDDVRIGRYATGVLNMTGGLFISTDRGEALDLANRGYYYGDSVAIVNLSGGVIDVASISVGSGTADITISGTGMIKLDGDKSVFVQELIDSGVLHGPYGVVYNYDPVQNRTIVIPIDPNVASEPYPEHEATIVPFDVVLHWSPGDNVGTGGGENGHQIFFSSDREDVNDRAEAALVRDPNFRDSNEFEPAIHLEYGQTYYWCVDEYNDPHPDSPWRGNIWSFTMAPSVDAGLDQWIIWPDDTVILDAMVQDDGDPNGKLTYWWEVTEEPEVSSISLDTGLGPFTIDIPGDVDPNQPYAVTPTATVTELGLYELKLYVDDQLNEANDMVQIIVREAGATPAGPLSVSGCQIVDQNDQPVSFAGMSFFWTNDGWGAWPYYNADCVNWLVSDWRVTIVRAAMGIQDSGGYLDSPTNNKNRVIALVDAAIDAGIYVVIDWHSHYAEDNQPEAIDFFEEMATTYGGYDNVIYEIYNEPKGSVSWPNTVKPYSEAVIAAIRAIDPNNLIIVGSPEWSQRVDLPAADPITGYSNIAYSVHFYPGMGHTQWLRDRCTAAMNSGIALMATEWGKGTPNEEVDLWMEYLEEKHISHMNWAVNDKDEGFSCLKAGYGKYDGNWLASDLTLSGTYARLVCKGWPGSEPPTPPAAPTGLSATPGDNTVSLNWNDNSEPDLDGYNVYRSTTSGSGYNQLNGSLVGSSDYTDNSASGGTTYYYVVTAVDTALDESGYSNEDSATPTGTPPLPELVGHWKLDEGSGTAAEDSSSEENDGTLGGDPQWVSGADGNALTLDGDDYVDLGNPSVLDFAGDFTLCAWVKNPGGDNVVAKGGDQSGGIRYALQVGSSVQLLVDDNIDKESVSGGSGLQDGEWHHVAGTRDGTTLRVYIDSVEVASKELPYSPYDLSGTSQHNAYIGAVWQHQDNMLGDFYTGSLDDVRIYSGALTSEQLWEVMLGSKGDFEPDGDVDLDDLALLVGFWLTDEPSVDIAPVTAPDGIINLLDFGILAENWTGN